MIEKAILLLIIALAGFPVGRIIAKHTKEEVRKGKWCFMLTEIISALTILYGIIFSDYQKQLMITASFGFIAMLALAALKENK